MKKVCISFRDDGYFHETKEQDINVVASMCNNNKMIELDDGSFIRGSMVIEINKLDFDDGIMACSDQDIAESFNVCKNSGAIIDFLGIEEMKLPEGTKVYSEEGTAIYKHVHDLINQIEMADYKDELGHCLKCNDSYIALIKFVGGCIC